MSLDAAVDALCDARDIAHKLLSNLNLKFNSPSEDDIDYYLRCDYYSHENGGETRIVGNLSGVRFDKKIALMKELKSHFPNNPYIKISGNSINIVLAKFAYDFLKNSDGSTVIEVKHLV